MDALDKQRQRALVSFLDEGFQSEMMFGAADRVRSIRRSSRRFGRSSPANTPQIITSEEAQLRQRMRAPGRETHGRRTTMNICMRALAALSLDAAFRARCCSRHAEERHARRFTSPPMAARLNAGLIVEASTSLPVLIIAGGFTITCTSSTLPQTAERRATFTGFLGISETLRIPRGHPQHAIRFRDGRASRRVPADSA